MPWDSSSGGSVAEAAFPSVPPAGSSDLSPRHRRRTTSTGSSVESLVRQSVEFESSRLSGGNSVRAMLSSQQQQSAYSNRQCSTTTHAAISDAAVEQLTEQPHSNSGKSSSGPIIITTNSTSSSSAAAAAASSASAAANSSSPTQASLDGPVVVKRTHSLKDDLIKRLRSLKLAGSNSGASVVSGRTEQPVQQQQQQQLNRSRPGSLRTGSPAANPSSAISGPSSIASVVVKVLPDKKLINKAGSSENLSPGSTASAAAAASDLSSLTSLVQRKRDRSQDSADSSNGSPPRRPAHIRKAPAPPPPPPPQSGSSANSASSSATTSATVQPSHASTVSSDITDEPTSTPAVTSSGPACKLKPPSGRHRLLQPSEDSSEPEECRSRDSPVEEQQQGSDGVGNGLGLGHHRSNSFEFLQDVAQARTAPKIRQPSAIRKISDSSQPHARDASPCKASPYSSSPPKTVSFNPTDEIVTYDWEPTHRKPHHRHAQPSRGQQAKLSDEALIDIHSSMMDMMEKIVANQRQFLTRVKEGSLSVASYRDNTKTLLTLQTRTIQKILDAIQANEKS